MGARPAIPSQELDTPCVNTIRFLSVDAVENAKSGHPGMPMGAAPMAYVLWTRHLRHSPSNPRWFDRDRFVLSAGHASMLLYSLLHLTGYDLPLEELRRFRQWGSATPGHPELGRTPGVEVSTGPLGQGFGNGVGQAIAQRVPDLIGGSADLDPSTHTQLKGLGDFESQAAALGSAGAELQGESGVSRWRPALRSDGVAGSAIAGTSSASMASARRLRGRSFYGNTDST